MSNNLENGGLELTLDSETFEGLRRSFDIVMQRLMRSMTETNSDEAKITIGVDVKLDTEFIPDYVDGKQNGGRDVRKPSFKHKVSSSIKVKDEASGNNNTEMELVYDEETKTYILKPVLGGEQMTMDDYLRRQSNSQDVEQDNGQKLLEAHTPELPGPTDEVVIEDAEFREIKDEPDDGSDNEPDDFVYGEPEEEV